MIEQVKAIIEKNEKLFKEYAGTCLEDERFEKAAEGICHMFCDKQIENEYHNYEYSLIEFRRYAISIIELFALKTGFTEEQIIRSLEKLKEK